MRPRRTNVTAFRSHLHIRRFVQAFCYLVWAKRGVFYQIVVCCARRLAALRLRSAPHMRTAHAHRHAHHATPAANHTHNSHRRSPNRNSSPRQVRAVRLVAFAVLLLPGFIPAAFHYWCGAGWFKMAPNYYTTILYHPATLLHYCTIVLIHYIYPRRMRSWFKMAACLYEDTTSGPTHRGLHGGTARPYAARRSPGRSRAL
jgi:hypothetical protein